MRYKSLFLLLSIVFGVCSAEAFSQSKEEEVFSYVQDEPAFPAGDEAMFEFLRDNIRYPKLPKDKKQEGALVIYFIVEKNGLLSDVKIIKGMSDELNNEVVRVAKTMPPWVPGMQNGKRVRVEKHLTLKFSSKGKLLEAK